MSLGESFNCSEPWVLHLDPKNDNTERKEEIHTEGSLSKRLANRQSVNGSSFPVIRQTILQFPDDVFPALKGNVWVHQSPVVR